MSTQSGKFSSNNNSKSQAGNISRGESSSKSSFSPSSNNKQPTVVNNSGKQNSLGKNISAFVTASTGSLQQADSSSNFFSKRELSQQDSTDNTGNLNSSLRRPSTQLSDTELATSRSLTTATSSSTASNKSAVASTGTSPASSSGNSAARVVSSASGAADSSRSPGGESGMQSTQSGKNKRRRYDLKLDLGSAHRATSAATTGGGNVVVLPTLTNSSTTSSGNTVTLPAGTLLRSAITPSGLPTSFLTNSGGTFAITPNATATLFSPGGVPVVLNSPDLDKFCLTSPQIHQFILHSELPSTRAGGVTPSLQSILFPHYNTNFAAATTAASTSTAGPGAIAVKQERATFVVPTAYTAVKQQQQPPTFEAGERFSNGFVVELDKLKQKDQQDQKNFTAALVATTTTATATGSLDGNTTPSTPTMLYLPAGSFIQSHNGGNIGGGLTFQTAPGSGATTLVPVYTTNAVHASHGGIMQAASTLSAFNTLAGNSGGGNIAYVQNNSSANDFNNGDAAATASSSGGRANTKNNKKNPAAAAAAAKLSAKTAAKKSTNAKRSSSNLLQLPQQQQQSTAYLDVKHSGHNDTTSEASGSTNNRFGDEDDDDDDDDDVENEPSQTGGAIGSSTGIRGADKTERKRERNRLAAAKCRARKIDRITELEKKVSDINDVNVKLELQRDSLSEEVRALRERLREHEAAGCMIEQQYTAG